MAAKERRRPAFDELVADDWVVSLGRRFMESNIPTGALIAYSAVCAQRDRGKSWGHEDKEGNWIRESAQKPRGGWPALAGTSRPTWKRWLESAFQAELTGAAKGTYSDSRKEIALLKLIEPERLGDEQFARIPAWVWFSSDLSKRAKRVYACIALYASRDNKARVANATIAKLTGFDRRNCQRAIRELENAGAIVSLASKERSTVGKYRLPQNVKKQPPPNQENVKKQPPSCKETAAPGANSARPPVKKQPPLNVKNQPPNQEDQETSQEQSFRNPVSLSSPRGDAPPLDVSSMSDSERIEAIKAEIAGSKKELATIEPKGELNISLRRLSESLIRDLERKLREITA